ncbi:aminopeptidase N [Colwellia sp. MEBiC06753]
MSEFTAKYLADYLPPDFSIATVDLTFELVDNATLVTSQLTVKKVQPLQKHLTLNGEHLTLKSVAIDGQTLTESDFEVTDTALTILNVADEFELTIVTEIDPANNTALEGLYKSGAAYCTQCEAEGFRRITYYLDRPDVMAVFTTKVIAPKADFPYLLANGNPIDRGELSDGRHFVTWHDPFPKPCYLFALVAGDFDLLQDTFITQSGREVALEIFVDKGNKAKAEHAMTSLKHSMKWDEQVFGLEYDLDIYMIVAVDFFNMGAMENKGLNVFNSKYVLADNQSATDTDFFNIEAVIAHEYFHNWTGNRVTCRDWFQLSLKEGLTVFRDQQFSADMHSAAVTRIQNVKVLRAQQFAEDAGPMSHPIRPEKVVEMNNFYTLTVYEKGAEVIRMLHTLLGEAGFRKGMDLYFKRFDGQAVTCDDFVNAMADANHKDLTLFKNWYSQSGTPELSVSQSFDAATQQLTLTVKQFIAPSKVQPEKLPLHIPIKIELIEQVSGNVQSHLLELTKASDTWIFDAASQPVVAFLGDFSAPVNVKFSQTDEELLAVVKFSQNSFCVWDAAQQLMSDEIIKLMANSHATIGNAAPSSLFGELIQSIITSAHDAAFKALMLTLPSFDEMVSRLSDVNPQQLTSALTALKRYIAQTNETQLLALYQAHIELSTLTPAQQVAAKSLANCCLSYLTLLPQHEALMLTRYQQAEDMTTRLGAVQAAIKNAPIALVDKLLADFEQRWQNDTLVMDKWFSLNASICDASIFERLSQLMARSDFSLNNPNRARSLIGAFAMQNPQYFHEASGKGYAFLAEQVVAMDKLNPQVASRLITPLIQFSSFDQYHQGLIKNALAEIAKQENLSKDVSEKLAAALAE